MRTHTKMLIVTGSAVGCLAALAGTATAQPNLQVDKTVVAPGETVHVSASCGGEQLGQVGSEAFAPTGADGPYTGNGGTVVFSGQSGDAAQGAATVRSDAIPGTYPVTQRCGGGNAGGIEITVT